MEKRFKIQNLGVFGLFIMRQRTPIIPVLLYWASSRDLSKGKPSKPLLTPC